MENNTGRLVLFGATGLAISIALHFAIVNHINWPAEVPVLLALISSGGLISVSVGRRFLPPLSPYPPWWRCCATWRRYAWARSTAMQPTGTSAQCSLQLGDCQQTLIKDF